MEGLGACILDRPLALITFGVAQRGGEHALIDFNFNEALAEQYLTELMVLVT